MSLYLREVGPTETPAIVFLQEEVERKYTCYK